MEKYNYYKSSAERREFLQMEKLILYIMNRLIVLPNMRTFIYEWTLFGQNIQALMFSGGNIYQGASQYTLQK